MNSSNYPLSYCLLSCHSSLTCLQVYVVVAVVLSVNEKLPESKSRYFEKYIIQLNGYFCIKVSGQRQTGLGKNTSFTSPGTMVHVMHVLFVFFAVFEKLIASFS